MDEDDATIEIKVSWWVFPLLSLLMIPVRLKLLPEGGAWHFPFQDFIQRHGLKPVPRMTQAEREIRQYGKERPARRHPLPDPRPIDVDDLAPPPPKFCRRCGCPTVDPREVSRIPR